VKYYIDRGMKIESTLLNENDSKNDPLLGRVFRSSFPQNILLHYREALSDTTLKCMGSAPE